VSEATNQHRYRLEVEQQRAIAAQMFEAIILQPATKSSKRFNPERLQVVWRQE
jgi:hypothetical protein